jgi:hypothetical protein
MPVRCAKCNHENDDGQMFCSVCGADLIKIKAKVSPAPAASPAPAPHPPQAAPGANPASTPLAALGGRPHLVDASSQRRYMLSPTDATTIGTQGCAVLLTGSGVEMTHAKIMPAGSGFTIEGVQGTFQINGQSAGNKYALQPADLIQIGSVELVYHGAATPAQAANPVVLPKPAPAPRIVPPAPVVLPKPAPLNQNHPLFQQGGAPAPSVPLVTNPQTQWGAPQLTGRVIAIDGPRDELPDPSLPNGLIKLAMPLLRLFQHPKVVALTHRPTKPQPLRLLRVQDSASAGQEREVRVKGDFLDGRLQVGDDVSFWGVWSAPPNTGTLKMRRAFNHRQSSVIRLTTVDTFDAQMASIVAWTIVGAGFFVLIFFVLNLVF